MTRIAAPSLLSIALTALLMAGCAGPEPVASPTPESTPSASAEVTPTPTPEPAPPALVTVAAEGLTVTDTDGAVMLSLPYSAELDVAIAQISEALGETPTTFVEDATPCVPASTVSSWGGLQLLDPPGFFGGPGAVFMVRIDGVSTTAGVPIVASAGYAVGDSLETVAALPDVSIQDFGPAAWIWSELQGASYDDPAAWGAFGIATDGVVVNIKAPMTFNNEC
ncbi:MAG: hypothetical protein RL499_1596 [Actinomycetota bacterium]|jgi:hypothetical protein